MLLFAGDEGRGGGLRVDLDIERALAPLLLLAALTVALWQWQQSPDGLVLIGACSGVSAQQAADAGSRQDRKQRHVERLMSAR